VLIYEPIKGKYLFHLLIQNKKNFKPKAFDLNQLVFTHSFYSKIGHLKEFPNQK